MTALDRYVRLESEGLWRPGPDMQRRAVTIAFGDATLVIADQAARPLAHWSLPALIRQNPGDHPAIYAPDDAASEALEISDPIMIDAIEQVRKALARSRPQPGKLRHLITAGSVGVALALAVFWLPGALMRQTLAVVPASKRVEIGAVILARLQTATGDVCRNTTAQAAAGDLATRVFGRDTSVKIVVVPDLAQGALALPGGLVVLDAGLLEQADDPAAVAGFVLASRIAVLGRDPLEPLLSAAGTRTTFKLLTTGDIPRDVLQRHADLELSMPPPVADPDTLRSAFATAQLPQRPYLDLAVARSGTMPDLGTDQLTGQTTPQVLSDSAWISLQNICNG